MASAFRCPSCGHALLTIDDPTMLRWAPAAAREPRPSVDVPLLLRVVEAAELLSVSRTMLNQLIAAGILPVVRIGRPVGVEA